MWPVRASLPRFSLLARPQARLGLVLWALAACSLDDVAERLRLNDRQFLLQVAEGAPQLSGVKVWLGFSGLELHFSGNCNQHFGKYRLRDGQLVLEELG